MVRHLESLGKLIRRSRGGSPDIVFLGNCNGFVAEALHYEEASAAAHDGSEVLYLVLDLLVEVRRVSGMMVVAVSVLLMTAEEGSVVAS